MSGSYKVPRMVTKGVKLEKSEEFTVSIVSQSL
jgi:hypothetical protein